MKDRLPPRRAAGRSHDRGNHIHHLRQATDLDAVGMVEQREDQPAECQRIFGSVDLLELARGNLPFFVGAGRVPPNVPFIKR